MLIDVLQKIASDNGWDPTAQRAALLKLLNNAARELHSTLECNAMYREITLVVPPNKIVALDADVGSVKGIREHTSDSPVPLQSMSTPRYMNNTWQYKYRNWRQLADSPIHTSLTEVGPLTINSNVVESTPVTLTVNGQTDNASREAEEVELDASSEVTTKNFGLQIFSISCRETRTGDITILSDGTEIAILKNTQNSTLYKMIDVSEMFWQQDTEAGSTLIDVLYKVPERQFVEDTDVFYAGETYDLAWYYMSMSQYWSTKQGQEAASNRYRTLALTAAKNDKDSEEQSVLKKINFGRNKFFSLHHREVYYPPFMESGNTSIY